MFVLLEQPRNDRFWSLDQNVLPFVDVQGDRATFFNIRDFRYVSSDQPIPAYDDREYDLSQITSLDYIVVPFTDQIGAHTMLSFGFADGEYLAISVEIRKESDESFSALRGMFNQYEIMYVVADERDVIDLRVRHRGDEVYLYPVKSSPEARERILRSMIDRINYLNESPEFYNTLTNNCTTNIISHANEVLEEEDQIGWSLSFVLPEHSDEVALELGLFDVPEGVLIEDLRSEYYISDRAREAPLDEDYSHAIRKRE